MSRAERRSTHGPAGELSYLVWPSSSTATPILYLHPVNTAASVWEAVADELDTDRRAVAVDYRAHGRSAAGGPYHPADYAADALAVLDACGIERAHVVCGSIGGAVAAELTAAAPGRVASIAAFGATLALGWPTETLDEVERDLRALGVREWFVRHGAEILGPAARAEAEAELVSVAVAGRTGDRDLDTVVEVLRTTFGLADSRRVAAAIADPPPTRVVVGSHDPHLPAGDGAGVGCCTGRGGRGPPGHRAPPDARGPVRHRGRRPRLPRHAAHGVAVTYSIVARDERTGQLGVACESHFFAPGAGVTWARPGIGAIATQAFVDGRYGGIGMDLLAAGVTAADALERLTAEDTHPQVRQVGLVAATGDAASWTGPACIADAGSIVDGPVAVQGNMLDDTDVLPAMMQAYHAAEGDLAERLMVAMEEPKPLAATFAAARVRPCSSSTAIGSATPGTTRPSTSAWRTTPIPSRSCAGCSATGARSTPSPGRCSHPGSWSARTPSRPPEIGIGPSPGWPPRPRS